MANPRKSVVQALVLSCLMPVVASADEAVWNRLRSEPNLVVFMRHTHAAGGHPLVWDESGRCQGEQVLSAEGKAHARKIGAAFAQRGVRPGAVISSPLCRCRETARIAFGGDDVTDAALRPLAAVGAGRAAVFEKTALSLIARHRGSAPVVFVGHQPNINVIALELIEIGDLLIGRATQEGEVEVVGKIRFDP